VALGAVAGRGLTLVRLPGDLPVHFDFSIDHRVIAYALALIAATTAIVGITVALRLSRASIDEALREHRYSATPGPHTHRVRKTLVVAQVAITFVLTIAGGLFARSLSRAERADLGFAPDRVLNV
jgi:hypothetical protein